MNTIRTDWTRVLLLAFAPVGAEFAQTSAAAKADFAVVEDAVGAALDKIRAILVTTGLSAATEETRDFLCPDCRGPMGVWKHKTRTVVTAQGPGTYPGVRYRCNVCQTDHYPIERANGLDFDRFTTGAKAVIAAAAADMPFAHVAEALIEARAIRVSPKEVDRTSREVAQWREDEEIALISAAKGGVECLASQPDLYPSDGWEANTPAMITVDGGMLRSTEKGPKGLLWFECRAGMIAPADHSRTGRKAYIAGDLSPDGIFEQMLAAWFRAGHANRDSLFYGDGALWIWPRVRKYFPHARPVLDIYHAGEYVASAAKAIWGERSPMAKQWELHARDMLIEEGGPRALLWLLASIMRAGKAVAPEQLRKDFHYLYTNRHRMPYAELLAKGLAIGSGQMESGIKQMCTSRLRRSGMKWTRNGAHGVLELRCAKLSGTLTETTRRVHQSLQGSLKDYEPKPLRLAA